MITIEAEDSPADDDQPNQEDVRVRRKGRDFNPNRKFCPALRSNLLQL